MSPQEIPLAKVVAQAWSDDEYRQRLVSDPGAVLQEVGAEVPEGVEVRVVEDSESVRHLILPQPPDEGGLSEDELERVAGGTTATSAGWWVRAVVDLVAPR